MPRNAHRLPLYGLAGALILLFSLAIVTQDEIGDQEEAALLVERTHEILESLQRVTLGLGTAESSLRGYVLMKDDRFLDDFEPALRQTEEGVRTARSLMRDPTLRHQLDLLEPKVVQRLVLLRDRLEAFRSTGDSAVSPEARRLSIEIRAGVAQLVEGETALLGQRSRVRDARLHRLRLVSPLGILGSLVLVGGAFVVLNREIKQRRRAEEEAESQGEKTRELLDETAVMLELGQLLTSCRTVDEANRIVADFGPRLFAGSTGTVSMLAESQNVLEVVSRWGERAPARSTFAPDDCWALRRGRPHHSDGRVAGATCAHVHEGPPTLCMPLSANGQVIGVLQTTESPENHDLTERRATVIGDQLAMALANLRLRETLRNQSIRDALTGLFNRRYTDETLAREIHRATREKGHVSVLVIDVDFFKKFNDTYGHQAGDRVLSQLGALLRRSVRGADVPSRMGGEELAVLLPGAKPEHAAMRAEAIRRAAESLVILHEGRTIGPVTLSIGVASFPEHGATAEDLVRAGDAALYRAKREGRNRVEVAAPEPVSVVESESA